MSMTILMRGTKLSDLQHIGALKDIGAEILDGSDVQAFVRPTHGRIGDAINAGYFGTSQGHYRVVYPFNEQATLLHGEVRITNESTGQTALFREGDSWFVTKGTSTLWEVLGDGYTKHYLAFA